MNYWELRPGSPERIAAKASLEKACPTHEVRRVRRAKIGGVNVVISGEQVYPFRDRLGEHLAYTLAKHSIPPLPENVSIIRDGDVTYLTDGRHLRLPIDLSGSPRAVRMVTELFRPSPEKESN